MGTLDDELASGIAPEKRGEVERNFGQVLRSLTDIREDARRLGDLLGLDSAQVQGMINSKNPEEAHEDFLFSRRAPERLARRKEWERREAEDAEFLRESERADREEFMDAASYLLRVPAGRAEQAIRNMSGGERADFTEDVVSFMARQRKEAADRKRARSGPVVPGSSEGESAGDPDMGEPLVDGRKLIIRRKAEGDQPPVFGRGDDDDVDKWASLLSTARDGVGPDTGDPLIDGMSLGYDSMVPFDEPYLKGQSPAPGTSRMPREEEM